MSGGNHSASGARPNAEAISVIECATVNAVTITTSARSAAERHDEAEQEQQVIGAAEDVPEPEPHEAQRRLVPARIELHEARVALRLEDARRAGRRDECTAVTTRKPSRSNRASIEKPSART